MSRRLPADWEPHARCVMAWPGQEARPGAPAPRALGDFALIARTIARFEPVTMLAHPQFVEDAAVACGPDVEVVELDFDDVWVRDSGPLFAIEGSELVAVDFRFNLWGSRTVPRERYATTGRLLAELLGIRRVEVPYALEGGAISSNGAGTLIALEPSILNENRNPGATREDLEGVFAEHLGVERTIWLEHGLLEDETDGHADNVAIFATVDRVLCPAVGPDDPNRERLDVNRGVLEAAGLEVVELASSLNCFIGNGCVVAPSAGEQELEAIGAAFPGRELVAVPGETLSRAGGGVHCVTQHVPLLPSRSEA
jgi:agmatine deiminase